MNIDKMYEDFTAHIAPKIAEGLVITKDYFIDLFGRYIKYLIITDSINLGLSIIVTTVTIIVGVKLFKINWNYGKENDDMGVMIMWIFAVVPAFLLPCWIFESTTNLIKSIYIPEVRIMEEIQSYKTNLD